MKYCTLCEEFRQERDVVDVLGLCHLESSRRRLFAKESDSIRASQVASVAPCSGTVDTKATGIRAACDDEMALKGGLGCSSNVQ